MEKVKLNFKLTERQTEAWKLLNSPESVGILYGGAKGGGKSYLFCLWVFLWTKYLIELFGLKPTANPPPLGFIGRKQGVDFNHTTLETFKRIIPAACYEIKKQEKEIIFLKTAKVLFGGLDDTERINKFNSAELAFIGIDQAEETERTDVNILQASLRLRLNDITPPFKELYTANPADCWLKNEFIDNPGPGKYYIPALPTDNPHLPDDYVSRLSDVFRFNQPLLQAYLYGDWSALQASNVVISGVMLENLKGVTKHPKNIKRYGGCDPSLGGDECVTYIMENGKILERVILVGERDPMKVAAHLRILMEKWQVKTMGIDVIGIGSGIASRLREMMKDCNIVYINSAETARDEARFHNVRTEIWWNAAELIQNRDIDYPEDEELRRQLCAPRYDVEDSDGQIRLEPKDKTKTRISRSPDRGDAFVYALWAGKFAKPIKEKKSSWFGEDEDAKVSSAVESAMTA